MKPVKKILWPTDASHSALRALDAAIVMAVEFKAEIYALQVIEKVARPSHVGFARELSPFDFPLYEQQMVESARNSLQATINANVPVSMRSEVHVELGTPRETIVAFCHSKEIDLIVMATHAREGFSHLWLGSVAEATIRQSPVPVLVIPQDTEAREE